MADPFKHGEYVWIDLDDGAEMVMVEENHGPSRAGSIVDDVTVRFINSETCTTVSSRSLDREHPKARAAALVRHAAGR